jgi:photoactive yellow protein
MNTNDPNPITFDQIDLLDRLETLDETALDVLSFGVIAMSRDSVVIRYNSAESALSGLSKDKVLGRRFFETVAPCTNNFMVSHCYETDDPLDRTIDYVFTLRMRPRKVRLRMLKHPAADAMYLVVQER